MDVDIAFGPWLEATRRRRLELTQQALGNQIGCSARQVRRIEAGERPLRRFQAELLADLIEIPPLQRAAFVRWAQDGLAHDTPIPLPEVEGQTMMVPEAGAAVSCQGKGCNGQDPEMMGCADTALTVEMLAIHAAESGDKVGLVELRFSRACQTNWARVTKLTGKEEVFRAYLRDATGDVIEASVAEGKATAVYIYGPMWYAPTGVIAVRACGKLEGYDEVCTNLH